MTKREILVVGLAMGAGLMYLLDPQRGRRRRARIRDKVVHGAHEIEDAKGTIASRARHLRNRARGAVAETRAKLRTDEVDDPVLEGRVRSQLGRLVPDPSGIHVSAEHGRVTLRGTTRSSAVASLIEGIQNIPGVHDVINRMQAEETAG